MNNVYGSVLVPTSTPTVVVGLTVPERSGYSLKGVIIWSEVDCEVTVTKNTTVIGGGRITGANQTLFLNYAASPFGLGAFDTVSVMATQGEALTPPASYLVSATLLVEQL
jgi:hypothetical protein